MSSSVLAFCFLMASVAAHAEQPVIKVQSGPEKVALLELYTSEGCSSCPPADRFVSRLGESGWYPRQLVPLGFHVTYWDYIGWRDVYAQKAFDKRQRAIADRQRSRSVYTPQIVLDGRDSRGFGLLGDQLQEINLQQPEADIALQAIADNEKQVQVDVHVEVADTGRRQHAVLYVALFENDISSRVSAGENRGKTLEHDHIVRELAGPFLLPSGQAESRHDILINVPFGVNMSNAGIAAFVQNTADGRVLQALAAPFHTR
jgi:hypothetical protein